MLFGFLYNPNDALQHFRKNDSVLAALIDEVGDFKLEKRSNLIPFEALLQSIVYQQLSGHAAASILNRVLNIYGDLYPSPQELLDTDDERLRNCGLSRSKILAVNDLAEKTIQGLLPSQSEIKGMDSEKIIDAFSQVRGIGRWTVEMLLIFNLGHSDILPTTDLGIRRGFSVAYDLQDLPEPKHLLKHGEKWKPYRSIASWYLWQAADPKFRS